MPKDGIELPAAVEVATYRIVTEAVTNVLRHANADRCWLTITAGNTIDIDVVDDGLESTGTPSRAWACLRSACRGVGGTVDFRANVRRGTHLHASLPAVLP